MDATITEKKYKERKPYKRSQSTIDEKLRRKRSRSIQEDETTVCACLSRLGIKTAIGVFLGIVITSFSLAAWNLLDYIEHSGLNKFQLDAGDMVSIREEARDLSSVLCISYTIKSTEAAPSFYLIADSNREMELDKDTQSIVIGSLNSTTDLHYKSVYLMAGSVVFLHGCYKSEPEPNQKVTVYFIKSTTAFDKIRNACFKRGSIDLNVDKEFVISNSNLCASQNSTLGLNITISSSDRYYVVLTKQKMSDFKGQVIANYKKSKFRVSLNLDSCTQTQDCSFTLPYNHDLDILASLDTDISQNPLSAYLVTTCEPRVAFWFALFGATPAVIFIASLVVCCVCGRGENIKSKDREHLTGTNNEAFRSDQVEAYPTEEQKQTPKNIRVTLSNNQMERI